MWSSRRYRSISTTDFAWWPERPGRGLASRKMAESPTRKRTLHEAAHKADAEAVADGDESVRQSKRPFQKASFNMAAHKLGYWAPSPDEDEDSETAQQRFDALEDSQRD